MVLRMSTRSARFLIWRFRESRRLIFRNRRNEILSSAARSSCGTSDRSTFCRRCSALAPETSLPSRSEEEASLLDSANKARELACGWCVRERTSGPSSEAGFENLCEVLQKISKRSVKRSHSSFDEVRTARRANANSCRSPTPIVFATSTAFSVCCTPIDKPLSRAKRQNATMEAAERSGSSSCMPTIDRAMISSSQLQKRHALAEQDYESIFSM